MTNASTFGWIFLALDWAGRDSPASLDKIIEAADALNKDIPSHTDLQASLGWLLQQGLAHRQGRDYGLTQLGINLMVEANSHGTNVYDRLNFLKQRFASAVAPTELLEISKAEWQQAYDIYYKRGVEAVKRLGIL